MVQNNNEKCDVQTSATLTTLTSFEESAPSPQSTNTNNAYDYEKNSSSDPSTIDSSGTALRTPRLLSFICAKPLLFYNGNKDAIGFACDQSTHGVIGVGAVFLVTALIQLAEEAAGCTPAEENAEGGCTKLVYGMRPTSMLTSIQTVAIAISAVCMPLVGALIDYTKHRRLVGRLSAYLLVSFAIVNIFIGSKTWFALFLLLIPFVFTSMIHATASFAYFPELSNDAKTIHRYASSFTAVEFTSMVLVLVLIMVLTSFIGIQNDAIATARLSQIVVVIWSVIFFGIAWHSMFSKKPALTAVPEGSTLVTAGFRKLCVTLRKIYTHYPAIKWYLMVIAFANSALLTVKTVFVTFMGSVLNLTTTETGITLLIVLFSCVPGSWISVKMQRLVNPKRSLQLVLLLWIFWVLAAAAFLREPGKTFVTYIFGAFMGIIMGWFYPTERGIYAMMIPKNRDAEFMGIYIFASNIIGFFPPLIFSVMNEGGVPLAVNLATLGIYFLIGLLALSIFLPSYEESLSQANENLEDVMATAETGDADVSEAQNSTTEDLGITVVVCE